VWRCKVYLLIDNYDSFTYNVYQYLKELTDEPIDVRRSDAVTIEDIETINPAGIMISPGPGRPEDAGISVEVVRKYAGRIPILGICLGHQAIGYAFGGVVGQAKHIVHGKAGLVYHDGRGVFRSIPAPTVFTRYHSLIVKKEELPECLEVTAWSSDGEIMGLRHKEYCLEGVQFHPESMASEYGKRLLKNFLNYKREAFPFTQNLKKIIGGTSLSKKEASEFMEEVTEGNLTSSQIAGYLTALNAKGITAGELAGCAGVLHEKARSVPISRPLLDTCGTGGDGLGTFNISSLTALAAASCGAAVAKHGNRAVSSVSGSADFFSALGIDVELSPAAAGQCIEETGFGFLFAPLYHSAMKHAAEARRDLGIQTVMNLVGPLSNPAKAEFQLIGVFSEDVCRTVAEAANLLGVKRVMVVYGRDGMDEISVETSTRIVFIDENGEIDDFIFTPESLNIPNFKTADLHGGSPEENAQTAVEIMQGRGNTAVLEAVCVNTAAALYVSGVAGSMEEGYKAAREAFKEKRVYKKYLQVLDFCEQHGKGLK
jgi:anthranilate synthase/phosphoribosyltransferase